MSAFIKFGCISIREMFLGVQSSKIISSESKLALLSQLLWREFYLYITYYFPRVLHGEYYNPKYNKLKTRWIKGKKGRDYLERWKNGQTGYPVVDAGMIQLNKTGYMHNRARLITANFMNRMLGLDWRWGEQYYATKLVDYDPSVNNGNWQWIASTGGDPKPYFQRLFNPKLQSAKFDPDAEYIKTWIPQLKDIPANELHNWDENFTKYDLKKLNYHEPVVNYKNARELSRTQYK